MNTEIKSSEIFWDLNGINCVCKACEKKCKQHGGVHVFECKQFVSNGEKIEKALPLNKSSLSSKPETINKPKNKRSFKRAKEFNITHVETGKTVTVKNFSKYVREELKITDEKMTQGMRNTIVTKKPYNGYIVEKIMG